MTGWNIKRKVYIRDNWDEVNRQLERPMMPVRTKAELEKRQNELKTLMKELV